MTALDKLTIFFAMTLKIELLLFRISLPLRSLNTNQIMFEVAFIFCEPYKVDCLGLRSVIIARNWTSFLINHPVAKSFIDWSRLTNH